MLVYPALEPLASPDFVRFCIPAQDQHVLGRTSAEDECKRIFSGEEDVESHAGLCRGHSAL